MPPPDQDAFAEFFVRHQGRVYAYIATLLPNRSDAEDVFQQTSLVLWQKWGEYDNERAFLPWACGIARNVVRNFMRTSRRNRVMFTDEAFDIIASEQLTNHWFHDEQLQAMRACLGTLSKAQSELVERCYAGRETVVQIAEQLSVSPTSLYMKLHRVRQSLLECIERRLSRKGSS